MGPLWLRLLPWCLSSKAAFGDLAGSLFMAIVGVVAIVDATVGRSANRTLRRDLRASKIGPGLPRHFFVALTTKRTYKSDHLRTALPDPDFGFPNRGARHPHYLK